MWRPRSCRTLLPSDVPSEHLGVAGDGGDKAGHQRFQSADKEYQEAAKQFVLRPRFENAYPKTGVARQDQKAESIRRRTNPRTVHRVGVYRRVVSGRSTVVPGAVLRVDRNDVRHIADRSGNGILVLAGPDRIDQAQQLGRAVFPGGGRCRDVDGGTQPVLAMARSNGFDLYPGLRRLSGANHTSAIRGWRGDDLRVLARLQKTTGIQTSCDVTRKGCFAVL